MRGIIMLYIYITFTAQKSYSNTSTPKAFIPMSPNLTSALASPAAILTPSRTSPSQSVREQGQDHRPQKPSPLILSPSPVNKPVADGLDGQRLDGQHQEALEVDVNGKPQRPGKGKRYKDFIAENGIKPFKKDRKVCPLCLIFCQIL